MAKTDIRKNASGYYDPTAYKAMKTVLDEESNEESERFHRLLHSLFQLCEDSGFHIENRIVIKDNKTGRIWR